MLVGYCELWQRFPNLGLVSSASNINSAENGSHHDLTFGPLLITQKKNNAVSFHSENKNFKDHSIKTMQLPYSLKVLPTLESDQVDSQSVNVDGKVE